MAVGQQDFPPEVGAAGGWPMDPPLAHAAECLLTISVTLGMKKRNLGR